MLAVSDVRSILKAVTMIAKAARLMKILFVERRLPGPVVIRWHSLLERFGVKEVTLKTDNGLSVTCMTNARVVFIEVFEKEEYALPDFDFKDKTVIDIGANQGFFTLYAASRGAKVFSFEPLMENVEILKRNLKQNGLEDRVTVFHAAVTGGEREIELFLGLNEHGNPRSETASIMNDQRGGVSVERRSVEGVPAPTLLEYCGLETCDVLKMDCEGAEFAIFENMTPEVLTSMGRLMVEFHNGRHQELKDRFADNGFNIFHADTGAVGLIKAVHANAA